MADRVGVVGLRGDEAELFRVFNDELVREIGSYVIHDDPDVILDACAFAWAQFLVHQPDREENWRGWLFRTASRQAWRLVREERRGAVDRVSLGSEELAGVVSLVDEIEARQDVVDALSVPLSALSGLPQQFRCRRRSRRFGDFTLVRSARLRNTRLCLIEVASSRS